jgi:hypothetical protein
MVPYDDLTEGELAFRALLERPTAYARWARARREAWAKTEAGRRAIAEAPAKIGKKPQRVYVEEPSQPDP